MSKASLLRLENGDRDITLDEALALADVLGAVPAQLLSPPEETWIATTETRGLDGEGLRSWLRHGYFAAEVEAARQASRSGALEREIAHHAQAYLDALRAKDDAGKRDALEQIVRATHKRATGGDDAR